MYENVPSKSFISNLRMWTATAICYFDGSSAAPHGLTLNLGDLVEITQSCPGELLPENIPF